MIESYPAINMHLLADAGLSYNTSWSLTSGCIRTRLKLGDPTRLFPATRPGLVAGL